MKDVWLNTEGGGASPVFAEGWAGTSARVIANT